MDAALSSILVTSGLEVLTAAAAIGYFHRVRIERPPIGVFNLRDVCFTFAVLVAIPPLYLHLPRAVLATVLTVFGFGLVYQTLAAATRRVLALGVTLALCAAEVALVAAGSANTAAFVAINDLVLLLVVVGVCNTWAQSGIRARDVAVFAFVVAVYDLIATGLLPTTATLSRRLADLPFTPTMGWGFGHGAAFSGLGDLLFIVLWPLVAEKAYSTAAGRAALAVTFGCVATITTLVATDVLSGPVPAMVLLGPAIVAHWYWLRRRHPRERTAGAYEASRFSGLPAADAGTAANLPAAVALLGELRAAGCYAVHDGTVLASGPDAVAVLHSEPVRASIAVPVLVTVTR